MSPGVEILRRLFVGRDKYALLTQDIDGISCTGDEKTRPFQAAASLRLLTRCSLLLLWTMTIIAATWYLSTSGLRSPEDGFRLYSPLQHVVEYEHRVFNQGLWNERTIYMGTPTNESTRAWEDIVEHGIIKLNAWEEAKLIDRTVRWLDDPDFYIGGVEMFHQLHCLYRIRKHIWAEQPLVFYGRESQETQEIEHIDHCIDYLRQTLMCHGDIGIISWRYDANRTRHLPNFNVTKSCRKFAPLLRWSDAHRAGNATPGGGQQRSA